MVGAVFAFEHVCIDGPYGPLVRDVSTVIPDTGVTAVIGPSQR
jgi:hypothetical protein